MVYLSQTPFSTGCSYILLDTVLGNIVEFNKDGGPLPWEEYEGLPEDQKWKAHETLSAIDFFARESERLRRLVYMPVPTPRGNPRFLYRAPSSLEEAELLAVEDEYDADQEVDSDYGPEEEDIDMHMEDLRLDSSDEDDSADEACIPDDELEGLKADAEQEMDVPGQVTASLGVWKPVELPRDTLVSS